MKKIYAIIAMMCCIFTACTEVEKYDDSDIKDAIASLEGRVKALESLNGEVAALKAIVEGKLLVSSCETSADGYVVTLSDGQVLNIQASGKSEDSGDDGEAFAGIPVVTVIEEGGRNYWGYYKDGKLEYLQHNGKNVEVTNITPAIRVNDSNSLEISIDGGRTWVVSDAQLSSGLFSSVEEDDDCLVLTLSDGYTQFRVPFVVDQQMQFYPFSGKQYFAYAESRDITVGMIGVDNFTVTEKPDGWKASLSEGVLTITAPAQDAGETAGVVKMLGIGEEPMIAQVAVSIGSAPCKVTIDQTRTVTVTPSPQTCFYGATLLEEFDPKSLAKELSGITNPMLSRNPFAESVKTMPLTDLVSEVIPGETYVVWAFPMGAKTASDFIYEAVSSVGVNHEVTDVTFEDAAISVSVKGTDVYYLIPMSEDQTLETVISDLEGSFANTYDRFKHTSSFRGLLSEVVESQTIAGQEYSFLVLPVKMDQWCRADALEFKVTLKEYSRGGAATVSLETKQRDFKSVSAEVSAYDGAHQVLVSTVSDADYISGGYSSDDALLDYLTGLTPSVYSEMYEYKAQYLESGCKYWIVAVAVSSDGKVGTPTRLEVSTKSVEKNNIDLTIGTLTTTLNSAVIPVTASGDIVSYRYFILSSEGGGYWYNEFVNNDEAAFNALVYGTVDECADVQASSVKEGIYVEGLTFGTNYLFCVIGYDKDEKISNMAKVDFTPSVGKVIKFSDSAWKDACPSYSGQFSANAIKLTVTFKDGYVVKNYALTKMSSEEYAANMPGAARQKTDYVLSHSYVLWFTENITRYDPGWYISADKPYLLITWEDENGWYEPVVYNTATGEMMNK